MALVRDAVRKVVWKTGKIVTAKGEIPEGQGLEYRDYFDYTEPVAQIPPHRVLAINRGDKEGPLKVRLEVSRPDIEAALFSQLPLEGHPQHDLFRAAAIDALDRLILPSMEREVRRDLTEAAEKHAVEVFARNLGSLLLQPPIPKQVVLAIDPGFRTGCKVAVLDPERQPGRPGGDLTRIRPRIGGPKPSWSLKDLVGKHQVGVVAIGNGTACRETEELVAEIIAEGTRFSQGDERDGTAGPPKPRRARPQTSPDGGPAEAAAAVAAEPVPERAGRWSPRRASEADRPTSRAGRKPSPPRARAGRSRRIRRSPTPRPTRRPPTRRPRNRRRSDASDGEDALGNGSGGDPHARHEPHQPAGRGPVEMLPPISGGAPIPTSRSGEARNPARRRPAGIGCFDRHDGRRFAGVRAERRVIEPGDPPGRRASRPRPSTTSPCPTTGSPTRAGGSQHAAEPRRSPRPCQPRRSPTIRRRAARRASC